jgi:hypothetical protein
MERNNNVNAEIGEAENRKIIQKAEKNPQN